MALAESSKCEPSRGEAAGKGHYRVRDLWLAPNLVSLLRLPLGAIFPWVSRQPAQAVALLLVSAATDVVDGLLARRRGQSTAVGAVLDGILDKWFAAAVIGTLLWQHQVSWSEACLLATRELGELPLLAWCVLDRSQRRAKAAAPRANWLGKLVTVIQFFGIGAVLTDSPARDAIIALCAVTGTASVVLYWKRELTAAQRQALRRA